MYILLILGVAIVRLNVVSLRTNDARLHRFDASDKALPLDEPAASQTSCPHHQLELNKVKGGRAAPDSGRPAGWKGEQQDFQLRAPYMN
ncbi:MAG: hypothetical protein ABI629_10545 [bacterium]